MNTSADDFRPRARITCPTGFAEDIRVEVLCTDNEYHQIKHVTEIRLYASPNEPVRIDVSMILGEMYWDGDVKLIPYGMVEDELGQFSLQLLTGSD